MASALADAILQRLPEPTLRLVTAVADVCRRQGLAAYLVGGVVRDFLAARPLQEADVVVVGEAARVAREAAAQAEAAWVIFEPFGTARLVRGEAHVDVAPARTESYPRSGALPQVSPASAIEEDLRRRDFSINAMAVPLAGDERALVDPWGGQEDLREGHLRALHAASFVEDPTRLVRAARFAARYGLSVERRTRRWMGEAVRARALDRVSPQRRGGELRRALAERPVLPVARLLQRWRLWDALCPSWRLTPRARRVLARLDDDPQPLDRRERVALVAAAEGWLSLWPARLQEQVAQLDARLALTREERQALERLAAARRAAGVLRRAVGRSLRPSTVDGLLAALPDPALAWVAEAAGGPTSAGGRWVRWYVDTGRHVRPHLSGAELIGWGVAPGPRIASMLRQLRAAVLDGRIRSRAEEVAWLRRRLGRRALRQGPGKG